LEQGLAFAGGAIRNGQGGTLALQALHRRSPGGSTGAEEQDVAARQIAPERFADRRGQAVSIGIIPPPAGGGASQGVDGPDGGGAGINLHLIEGEDLVGHGQVEPVKTGRMELGQGAGQIVGGDIEPEIAPRKEAGVGPCHLGQGRIVHGGAQRVLDRVPQDGEGRAGEGPRVEVGKSVDGLHSQRIAQLPPSGVNLGKSVNREP
jgi:hypothetical protein